MVNNNEFDDKMGDDNVFNDEYDGADTMNMGSDCALSTGVLWAQWECQM